VMIIGGFEILVFDLISYSRIHEIIQKHNFLFQDNDPTESPKLMSEAVRSKSVGNEIELDNNDNKDEDIIDDDDAFQAEVTFRAAHKRFARPATAMPAINRPSSASRPEVPRLTLPVSSPNFQVNVFPFERLSFINLIPCFPRFFPNTLNLCFSTFFVHDILCKKDGSPAIRRTTTMHRMTILRKVIEDNPLTRQSTNTHQSTIFLYSQTYARGHHSNYT